MTIDVRRLHQLPGRRSVSTWKIEWNSSKYLGTRISCLITTVAPAKAGAAAFCRASLCLRKKQKAASVKQQATSSKRQARLVRKLLGEKGATNCRASLCHYVTKTQGASDKRQAPSNKHQAASHELLAL
jgi:hypothetical protein